MAAGNGSGFETGTVGETVTASWASADSVVLGGGTAVVSSTFAAHGSKSVRMEATTASGGCYIQQGMDPTDEIAFVMYIYIEALPSADTGIMWLGDGTSQRMHVEMTSAGAIRVRDDANTARWNASVTTSTGTCPTGQWLRLEVSGTRHATTGTFRVAVYSGDGTTPLTGLDSGLRTGQNTGSSSWNVIRFGTKTSNGTNTMTMHVDDWDYDPASSTFIGPYLEYLPAPSSLTIDSVVPPSTIGGADGEINISWGSSAGATTYEMAIVEGEVTSGFTASTTDSASPHKFLVEPGIYTVAVRAV